MNLEAWLKEDHSLADQLKVMEGICDALNDAHSKGVLHRALEPFNIEVDNGGACDLTGAISAEVAMGKARTSALTKRPTKFFEDRVKERPAFVTFPTPGVVFQGGLPLMYQGECVGAIGVSGVQSHEDEQIAKAGVDALA